MQQVVDKNDNKYKLLEKKLKANVVVKDKTTQRIKGL